MYEAEESLISCLMTEPECIEGVYNLLSPEMFESSILGRLYFEYRKAFDDRKSLTLVQLHQNLEKDYPTYEIEDVIRRCAVMSALPFQVKGFAEVIVKHYKASCVKAMMERTDIDDAKIDDQIDRLIKDLEILQEYEESEGNTVASLAETFENDYFCEKEKALLFLNIEQIDTLTGGFEGGDVTLLGARPGCGKSSIAAEWAEIFAKQGKKVAYYNLEMQSRACFERFVAAKTGIEITRIRRATRFCNDEEQKYRDAISELKKQTNITIYNGSKRVSDIRKDVRKTHPDVVIVDYLQLISCDDRYRGNRVAEVGQISHEIKEVAMTYNIPIIALVQLSRAVETRRDHKPMLSDLRESGDLEQDASIVFFLYNTNENDVSEKNLDVAKSRQGKIGSVEFKFDGARLHFELADNIAPFGV